MGWLVAVLGPETAVEKKEAIAGLTAGTTLKSGDGGVREFQQGLRYAYHWEQ